MRTARSFVRVTLALVALAACGKGYGDGAVGGVDASSPPTTNDAESQTTKDADVTPEGGGVTDATSLEDGAPGTQDEGGTNDAGSGEAGLTDAGLLLVGPEDVSNACLRLPKAMPRIDNTHVITIYGGSGSPAKATVTVNLPNITLVLMSYDPLTWTVTEGFGGSVAKVYVHAYGATNTGLTTVTGLDASIPVIAREVGAVAMGYTRAANVGGGDYPDTIAEARSDIGGLETTYQGSSTVTTFHVRAALGGIGIEWYDTRVPCSYPCVRPGNVTKWVDVLGNATISGLKATLNGSASLLRTGNGPRCGKHYFEIDSPAGPTGVTSVGDTDLLTGQPRTFDAPAGTTGVAIDIEAKTVTYYTATAATTRALNLWYREALGPAWDTGSTKTGVVTLITRAPFTYAVPAGFATDL